MERLENLGERVRSLRKSRGLALREIAEKTGFSAGYLSDLERGGKRWNVEVLEKVANAFSVSPGLLQDPSVEVERLVAISEILEALSRLPDEKLEMVHKLIEALA